MQPNTPRSASRECGGSRSAVGNAGAAPRRPARGFFKSAPTVPGSLMPRPDTVAAVPCLWPGTHRRPGIQPYPPKPDKERLQTPAALQPPRAGRWFSPCLGIRAGAGRRRHPTHGPVRATRSGKVHPPTLLTLRPLKVPPAPQRQPLKINGLSSQRRRRSGPFRFRRLLPPVLQRPRERPAIRFTRDNRCRKEPRGSVLVGVKTNGW
jgi:hypothetical protein